jgi:hypothetical protein
MKMAWDQETEKGHVLVLREKSFNMALLPLKMNIKRRN